MDNESKEIIDYNCKYCGYTKAYIMYLKDVKIIKCIVCDKCGQLLSSEDMGYTGKPRPEWLTNAQCPYCASYDTKKITTMKKAAHIALFGVFAASKAVNQWHCNTCNSDF